MLELPTTTSFEGPFGIDLGQTTAVMGVINITPDSFSDGGAFLDPQNALLRADSYLHEGAEVIDLGAQSTRPGAEEVGVEEELSRLIPVLKAIRSKHPNVLISVDTFWAEVAEKSLEEGASWINDVSGGTKDPAMLGVVAARNCPFVLMHSRGNSHTMDRLATYKDVVEEVRMELLSRTESAYAAGINLEKLIWDPGLGFAKNNVQNIVLLRNLERLSSDGFPLLVGPSRKRFIGAVLDEPNPNKRIMGTAAVVCRCVQAGVAIVRVHDVSETIQTVRMASAIW